MPRTLVSLAPVDFIVKAQQAAHHRTPVNILGQDFFIVGLTYDTMPHQPGLVLFDLEFMPLIPVVDRGPLWMHEVR